MGTPADPSTVTPHHERLTTDEQWDEAVPILRQLWTDADHRGEGHGSDLLAFVEEWARNRDCEYVALAARAGNDDAVAFYEAEGMDR